MTTYLDTTWGENSEIAVDARDQLVNRKKYQRKYMRGYECIERNKLNAKITIIIELIVSKKKRTEQIDDIGGRILKSEKTTTTN